MLLGGRWRAAVAGTLLAPAMYVLMLAGWWIPTAPYWLPEVLFFAPWPVIFAISAWGRRDGRIRASAFALPAVPLAVLWAAMLLFTGRLQARPFDAVAWRDYGADGRPGTRARMLADLYLRHDLGGMSRQEVVRLLGPGDPSLSPSRDAMLYWLEPDSPFDYLWLTVRFDPSGHVSEYYDDGD